MTRVGVFLLGATALVVSLACVAEAADLPSQTLPPVSAPSCFASLADYLLASAEECPLTYAGITLYGTLDVGYGYETHGVPGNPSAGKVNYGIQKNSNNTHWLLVAQRARHVGDRRQNGRAYRCRLVIDRRR